MELLVKQNFVTVYPSNMKTRRYISLIKLLQAPFISLSLTYDIFNCNSNYLNTTILTYNRLIKSRYLDLNVWFSYKNILKVTNGSLTNNISLSYAYWTFHNCLVSLKYNSLPQWSHVGRFYKVPPTFVVRTISFDLVKCTFNKVTLVVLLSLLNIYPCFLNTVRFSYAFIFLPLISNFLSFYNAFYIRVSNF
jgi:hypothetical protein